MRILLAWLLTAGVGLAADPAEPPIRLPDLPPPAPTPVVTPGAAVKLATEQLYVIDSDLPLVVLCSPAGVLKVTEEAGEVVEAAAAEPDARVVSEAADLVYHMLVLLACRGVGLSQVEDELARRFGISGLDEKAARTAAGGHHNSPSTSQRTDGANS
jgi:phosphoribosyl-ATP pyrophosphohydrolase